jgi:hypothetical protein
MKIPFWLGLFRDKATTNHQGTKMGFSRVTMVTPVSGSLVANCLASVAKR